MPATTCAARKSPASLVTPLRTISPSATGVNSIATTNAESITAEKTCSDYLYNNPQQLHQQQQQQHQLQLQQQQPPYYHQHHPPSSAIINSTISTSFATLNGNSNASMANGNLTTGNGNTTNNNNHGNQCSTATTNAATHNVDHLTTTSSSLSSSSTVTVGSVGPLLTAAGVSIIKKTASSHALQLHASREDITSLGGTSSVNSQLSITNNSSANNNNNNILEHLNSNDGKSSNNNIGSSNNNINNTNNNIKDNKDHPPNTYFNGNTTGSTGSTTGSITGIGPIGSLSSRNTESDDPGDGLGPLPTKWETAYTERGEVYFIDHNTGTSHWLDPRLSKFQKKSLEDCGDDELPYGWEKIEDSLYGTYYIDHVNRRTQYENPVLEAKRRAAEQKQKQQDQRTQTPTMLGTNSNEINSKLNQLPPPPPPGVERRPMHPPPPEVKQPPTLFPYKFTRNPADMQGERITTTLLKSARGLGIKIVGGDDGIEEFLQIKSIVPHGPAWQDGQLQSGDVLVFVNETCVLGFTHHEMVNVFQSILPGETVTLEVRRGYPLPFDPNDPNTEVVTTIAVDTEPEKQRRLLMDLNMNGNYNFHSTAAAAVGGGVGENSKAVGGTLHALYHPKTSDGFILMKKPEVHSFSIMKGSMGFGFTIADSGFGQKVKKILDRNCCTHLQEGDVLLEINDVSVRNKTHLEVVQYLKDCSKTEPTTVKIQRAAVSNSPSGNVAKLRKNFIGNTATGLFRSKTPTADIYSTQQKEVLPMRPKTPLVDTRRARVKTPNNELNDAEVAAVTGAANIGKLQMEAKSTNSLQEIDAINQDIPFMDPYPKLVTSLSERLAEASLREGATNSRLGFHVNHTSIRPNYENQEYATASNHSGSYNPIYGLSGMPPPPPLQLNPVVQQLYTPPTPLNLPGGYHHQPHHNQYQHGESCLCYDCQDYRGNNKLRNPPQTYYGTAAASALTPLGSYSATSQYSTGSLQAAHIQNERMQKRVNELLSDRRRVGFSSLDAQGHQNVATSTLPAGYLHHHQPTQQLSPAINTISQHQLQQQQQQQQQLQQQPWPSPNFATNTIRNIMPLDVSDETEQYELSEVTLERQAMGFGFRIVGGTEEGSQVTVGHIVPGGAADNDHRINTGDEILSIDGVNVVNSSHHKVVSLMGEAALRGQVSMILRRRLNLYNEHLQTQKLLSTPATNFTYPHHEQQHITPRSAATTPGLMRYPYDVIVSRHENEGFGFVIISSSNQFYGSTIGKLIPESPADRCGELKVGDRIIAVNRIDIAGMSHGEVVNLIKESGLHVRLTIGSPIVEGNCSSGGSMMQASPSQLSQTTITQPNHLLATDNTSLYFDHPGGGMAISSISPQQHQQQQQQQLQQQQQHHQQQQPQL